ncbi:MAG: hypothetical protein IJU50_01855 [Lachnospiraceae bacterium]|nr:hypothetical protein [Lachnospiraceae bacterium]
MANTLLILGFVLMGIALLIGLISIILFSITGSSIKKKLKNEYGEKR